jgi:hypothetical protein
MLVPKSKHANDLSCCLYVLCTFRTFNTACWTRNGITYVVAELVLDQLKRLPFSTFCAEVVKDVVASSTVDEVFCAKGELALPAFGIL